MSDNKWSLLLTIILILGVSTPAIAKTKSAACATCSDLPFILTKSSMVADGIASAWWSTSPSGCHVVNVTCSSISGTKRMSVMANTSLILATGVSKASAVLTCDSNGRWTWTTEGVIDSVSCLATAKQSGGSTRTTRKTTASKSTTKTRKRACSTCSELSELRLHNSTFASGAYAFEQWSNAAGCLVLKYTCYGHTGTELTMVLTETGSIARGVGTQSVQLTCSDQGTWHTSSGTTVDGVRCAYQAAGKSTTTTLAPASTAQTTRPTQVASTKATTAACTLTAFWTAWGEWTACTDSCGACGTHTRFRECKLPACLMLGSCDGLPTEEVPCNTDVCRYPRDSSCCSGFSPVSNNGQFICNKTA